MIIHPFEPVWNKESRLLILGSFPSVRSRSEGFYYGHPRNRFWPLMARLTGEEQPVSIEDKRVFLLKHGLALWDVLQSCDITGSSDASIRNAVPNNIAALLHETGIQTVLCNGAAAGRCYEKWTLPLCGVSAVTLPSTSPANAGFSMEKLAVSWGRYIPTVRDL